VCCPALDAFPKHLLLAASTPAQRAAVGRTGFYPSPMVSDRFERRAHARFLVRKIDALIANFAIPGPGQIRVTPSAVRGSRARGARHPVLLRPGRRGADPGRLEPPALPARDGADSVSYNADRWAAGGTPAAAPLQFQTGAFDFLRIEGHVAARSPRRKRELDALVTGANLPVDVVLPRARPAGEAADSRGATGTCTSCST